MCVKWCSNGEEVSRKGKVESVLDSFSSTFNNKVRSERHF